MDCLAARSNRSLHVEKFRRQRNPVVMPRLIFFSALDSAHELRGAVMLAPGKHDYSIKSLQPLAKRLALAGTSFLAVAGEANAQGEKPWLVLTDTDFSNLDSGAVTSLKAEMARLLTYSDSLRAGPISSPPGLVIEENLRHWEHWFRHLPSLEHIRVSDPLEIQLGSRLFFWSLAAILITLSLLCAGGAHLNSSIIGFGCYVMKLVFIAGLLIGMLILPVFGGLTEQARTLAICQAVLFLCFQAISGNLWSVNSIGDTFVKTAILFLVSAAIGKLARLSHETVLRAALVQSICSALGVGVVIWVLAYPLF
ncbi:MAG: hypothetical protein JWL90_3846 [Chthoniobacteraceae bacterium]|nr:hypothetical protein [Chthoniobacteraceae bacterium]